LILSHIKKKSEWQLPTTDNTNTHQIIKL